jgi:hypothetical protein
LLDTLKNISPLASQHVYFLGHYALRDENSIDLATMRSGIDVV